MLTYYRDLFKKATTQTLHDIESVEFFSLKSNKWEVYNARLSIGRHSAAACCIKEYLYVIGGHKVS
jgi:hypothetical protein